MKIDETLKNNIRADIENVLPITLKTEDIDSLIRCLEITIGHHYASQKPETKEITDDIELNENQQSLMFAFIDWLYSARYSKYWGSDEPNNGKWYKSNTLPDRQYYTLKELFNISLKK